MIEDTSTYGLWKVQAGSIAMSTAETSDTFTLTAVDTANTFVNGTTFNTFGYTGQSSDTTTGNVDSATATVTLTNGTTVTAVRGVTDTTTLDVPVQAVEFLPAFTQSAYRLFNNVDSTDVGTVLADQDTAATLGATGAAFRLRALLHLDTAQLAASGQNFKLQFAQQSGTCDTAFSGETYADVTGATVIAYNNNTPADGDNLTANANDPPGAANPHFGHTIVNQDYEELNNFTNSVAATPRGQDGLWDFSLKDNGATASTAYCLRAVKSDGTVLDTYSVIPQITTAAGATTTLGDGTDGSNSTIGPGASASAFPTVQSLTESIFATDTTAHAVSMPATVNSGDLLLAAITTTSDDDEPAPPTHGLSAPVTAGGDVVSGIFHSTPRMELPVAPPDPNPEPPPPPTATIFTLENPPPTPEQQAAALNAPPGVVADPPTAIVPGVLFVSARQQPGCSPYHTGCIAARDRAERRQSLSRATQRHPAERCFRRLGLLGSRPVAPNPAD